MRALSKILALLLLSSLALAIGGKTFTWIPPVERMDQSPLPQAEIAGYRIYCDGNDTTPVRVQPNVPLDTDTWAAPDGTFSIGIHTCHATTIDTEGQESDPSNIVNFIVRSARPNPPIFAVQ